MTEQANSTDAFVGSRLRQLRNRLGLSQADLGSRLGISPRKVQDYEGGRVRVGATQLAEISRILGTPVTYFFADNEEDLRIWIEDGSSGRPDHLLQNYRSIEDPGLRNTLAKLASMIVYTEE